MPPLQADRPSVNHGITMAQDSGSKVKDRYKVKCVLVGDGATGKTSLILSYSSNAFPTEYVPTAYDTYSVDVTVNSLPVRLELCDTAGQDDFDHLRPLCYPGTDAFLLCFSVMNPTSFYNISDKWVPELRDKYPQTPLVLVGTLSDLRGDVREIIQLDRFQEKPVTEEEAELKARDIGALSYIECSALTQKNMKEVFDLAILAALDRKGVLAKCNHKGLFGGSKRWKKSKGPSLSSSTPVASSSTSEQKPSIENSSGSSIADVNSVSGHPTRKKTWRKFCCFM